MREQKAASDVPVVLISGHEQELVQVLRETSPWDVEKVYLLLSKEQWSLACVSSQVRCCCLWL